MHGLAFGIAEMARRIRAARFVVEGIVWLAAAAMAFWAIRADLGWFERHVVPSFCVAATPTWPWHATRALGLCLALLLVTVVRPRLVRVPPRELAVTSATSLAALILALGVGELILRR